jgi:hypothetical protein
MAKPIVLTYAGETSSLEPARLDRKKLYGHRRRLPMDPAGSPCTRAALTEDGSLLVRAGMTAQGYLDDEGNWVPNQELVGLDAEGQPLPLVPSTLGAERPLEGPVDASEVLDCAVDTVYALSELELSPLLRAALDEGQIFRFEFNYRADYSASPPANLTLAAAAGAARVADGEEQRLRSPHPEVTSRAAAWYFRNMLSADLLTPHDFAQLAPMVVSAGDNEAEEAINCPFCPLQEKFHTFVLRGLRNIPEAP